MREPRPLAAAVTLVSAGERDRFLLELAAAREPLVMPLRTSGALPSVAARDFWQVHEIDPEEGAGHLTAAGPLPPVAPAMDHLVVSLDGYELEGALFAGRTGRRHEPCASWREALDQLACRPATLTVIGDVTLLPYPFFSELLLLPGADRIGLLTGFARNEVRWSLLKALLLGSLDYGRDLFLLGCPDVEAPALFTGIDTLWWGDFAAESLAQVTSRDHFFCALLSHSNGIDGNFDQTILCPVGEASSIARRSRVRQAIDGAPSCVTSGLCQRDPQGSRHRFHPHALRAGIVLYDTCAGFLTTGAFALPQASLGLTFLTGTCGALLTSVRKKTSSVQAVLLFRALLYDGHPLSFITGILNRFQSAAFGEMASFVLFGDPAFRVANGVADTEIHLSAHEDALQVEGWRTHALRLGAAGCNGHRLVPLDSHPDVLSLDLAARGEAERERWLVRPEPVGGPVVLCFTDPGRTALFAEISEVLRSAIAFLDILTVGLALQFADPQALREIVTQAREIAPWFDNLRQASAEPACHAASERRLREVGNWALAKAGALNLAVPPAWEGTRQWLVLHHSYTHALDLLEPEHVVAAPCPVCGSLLTRKRSTSPGLPGVMREMYTCIRCGVVADVPAGWDLPEITGHDRCFAGKTGVLQVSLRPRNPRIPVCLLGYFGGFGAQVVRCRFAPQPVIAADQGGGKLTANLQFELDSDCPPGLYSFVVVGSQLLTPFTAAKYITVLSPLGPREAL